MFFISYKHWKLSISYSALFQQVEIMSFLLKNYSTLSLLFFKHYLLRKCDEQCVEMSQKTLSYLRMNKESVLIYLNQQSKQFQREVTLQLISDQVFRFSSQQVKVEFMSKTIHAGVQINFKWNFCTPTADVSSLKLALCRYFKKYFLNLKFKLN